MQEEEEVDHIRYFYPTRLSTMIVTQIIKENTLTTHA